MKKITKIIAPILIVAAIFFTIQTLNKETPQVGEKEITINIKVKNEDDSYENIKEVKKDTDQLTVGDVLDEINGDLLNVELEGDKDSEFGRFIVGIEEYKTEDMAKGPWWMIYSENNKDCVEAGFCSGIDAQNVYDKDVFDLVFE